MRIIFVLLCLFLRASWAEPVSIDLPAIPLSEAVRVLAGYAHLNVVVSPEVQGVASLRVSHAEPLPVFESLLLTHGLTKSAAGNVWYIAPRAVMQKNMEEQAAWRLSAESAANLVTQVWKIRYAKAVDLAGMLSGENMAVVSERGQLQADARTNILFARDTRERLGVIESLVRRLDVPVRQVMIEARLVSVDQDAERLLGIKFDVKPAEVGNSRSTVMPSSSETAGRYSIAVAHLPDGSLLDVKLAALEQQGRADKRRARGRRRR